MMDRVQEDERAFRISIRMEQNHMLLSSAYENLVDRNFESVKKEIKIIRQDLLLILKSMEDDDF